MDSLTKACSGGDQQLPVIRFLLQSGFVLTDQDFLAAVNSGSLKTVQYLTLYRNTERASVAARNGSLDLVKWYVESAGGLDPTNFYPLQQACIFGHLDLVKYLTDTVYPKLTPELVKALTNARLTGMSDELAEQIKTHLESKVEDKGKAKEGTKGDAMNQVD